MGYSAEDFEQDNAWAETEVPEGMDPHLHHGKMLQARAMFAAAMWLDQQGGCETCVDAVRGLGLGWSAGTPL